MKAAEREASRQAIREQAERALKNYRLQNRLRILCIAAGQIGGGAMFALTRALLRHEPFDIATMGLYIAAGAVTYTLIRGGYVAWERWRAAQVRSRRARR